MTPAELLQNHDLFRDLPETMVAGIAALARCMNSPQGTILFGKGDEGDCFYGILSGRVQIGCTSEGGREIIFSILETGAMFGEIAVLDGGPRTAGATTLEDSILFRIGRADLLRLIAASPELSMNLIRHLCMRLRRNNENIEDAAMLGLPARLAKRLLSLCETRGHAEGGACRIDIRLSQQELAQMLGVTRESVNKHLTNWKTSGIIGISRGRITLCDIPALQQVSQNGDAA